jgi:hypothetical protein
MFAIKLHSKLIAMNIHAHHEVLFLRLSWNQELTQTSCAVPKLYKFYRSCLPPNWMNIIWMVAMTHHCNIEKKTFLPTIGGRNQCWLVIDFFSISGGLVIYKI